MGKLFSIVGFLALLALISCSSGSGQVGSGEEEQLETVVVPEGKSDNFFSKSAKEYYLEGRTSVTLGEQFADANPEEKIKRVKELIPLKQVVIGWFLNQYVAPKSHDASNKDYGGFNALTKNGSYEDMDIQQDDNLTFSFTFRQEIAGNKYLIQRLPAQKGNDGRFYFKLAVGKISNYEMTQLRTNEEWYRKSPWKSFDPNKVDESKIEWLELTIWEQPRTKDAWIDYNKLFSDGKLTIGIHFGWDYHDEYHIKHSKEIYNWLLSIGYKSPESTIAEYDRNSGPLTRTIKANGQEVEVQISIYWGEKGKETDPDTDLGGKILEEDMIRSFATREVIIFSGHSGPFYGFALANWRKTSEGDLDDAKIPFLQMPKEVYQVVMADGCETYALGEAFFLNKSKPGLYNLDIITTTNYSNASSSSALKNLISALAGTEQRSEDHIAITYGGLLLDLGRSTYRNPAMYGIHGIDDNPHGHPYGVAANLCQTCKRNSDCGGKGNKCVKINGAEKVCAFECTANDGCPTGYGCRNVAQGYTIESKQCLPVKLSCYQQNKPEAIEPQQKDGLMINEVLADPPNRKDSDLVDPNGDGKITATQDEFVEIFNSGQEDINLTGFILSDRVMDRFTFPGGVTIKPGEVVVVFGGGDRDRFSGFQGIQVFTASNGLGLSNKGDIVTIRDQKGNVVDQVVYGAEGGKNRSLTRSEDGQPDSTMVPHPNTPFSPGKKADGSDF